MGQLHFTIDNKHANIRIDIAAADLSGFTRSRIKTLIEDGRLKVNKSDVKHNYKVRSGDIIEIAITDASEELIPEYIPIEILYHDNDIMVLNKPPYMVVYPSAGHDHGTLINAIAFHADNLASIGGPLRPGIVHRLDKDTSGVMVVALSDKAYYGLVEQFSERSINRRYKAIVYGRLKGEEGEISLSIGRSDSDRKKMSTKSKRPKEALTAWKVIERLPGCTLISAKLGTGRTHQIRVHFASTGHPVLGDKTYGSKTSIEISRRKITFPRQMLHAELLGFTHPLTMEYMEFSSPLPEDMNGKLSELRDLA